MQYAFWIFISGVVLCRLGAFKCPYSLQYLIRRSYLYFYFGLSFATRTNVAQHSFVPEALRLVEVFDQIHSIFYYDGTPEIKHKR